MTGQRSRATLSPDVDSLSRERDVGRPMDQRDPAADDTTGRATALRVVIVEDTPTMAFAIQAALREAGMETRIATTGADAIAAKTDFRPDVVLVDLQLPDVSGMELVAMFARDADCGVIVVTANGAEADRIAGLDTGADDYIVKPAALRELAARIRAVHRRLYRPGPDQTATVATLTIDPARRVLAGPDDSSVILTEAEAAALDTLLDAAGASVSREMLSQAALKRSPHADDRSVDQLVLKLRRKIVSLGASERTILSARRLGYVIPDPGQFRQLPAPKAG